MSRRIFLRGSGLAVAGGSGALLAACAGSGDKNRTTATETTTLGGSATEGDIAILNSSLDLENRAIAAYTASLELLSGRLRSTAERFREHERAHAEVLSKAITELRGTPNPAKEPGEYGFPALDDEDAVLEFAIGIENTAIAWYIDALPKLSTPELRGRAASIVTVEAEQLSVLLAAMSRPPVPEAFVVGRRT